LIIKKEIKNIIDQHDFIIVPGLGAFIAEYKRPYVNNFGDLVAGQRYLRFESVIKKDIDNKLFILLSDQTNIPTNYLLSEYSDYLSDVQSELKNHGKFVWENFGSFFVRKDGDIEFFPESIELDKHHKEEVKIEHIFVAEEPSKPDFRLEPPVLKAPSPALNDSVLTENVRPKDNVTEPYKILLYMVPLFLLIGGLAFSIFVNPESKAKNNGSMMAEIDSLAKLQEEYRMDSVYKSDPIEESIYSVERTEEEKSKIEPKIETKVERLYTNTGAILNIGVYSNKENAELLASTLAEEGVAVRLRPYKGQYKLVAVSADESQTADFEQKITEITGSKPVRAKD
jgi:hypothetical protein